MITYREAMQIRKGIDKRIKKDNKGKTLPRVTPCSRDIMDAVNAYLTAEENETSTLKYLIILNRDRIAAFSTKHDRDISFSEMRNEFSDCKFEKDEED